MNSWPTRSDATMSCRRSSSGNPVGCPLALPQKFERQPGRLSLGVFHDDLGQGHSSEVFPGFGVDNLEVLPISDQCGDIFQVDVAAAGSVVESAVCVFLDDDLVRLHAKTPSCAAHIFYLLIDKLSNGYYILGDAATQHKRRLSLCQEKHIPGQ